MCLWVSLVYTLDVNFWCINNIILWIELFYLGDTFQIFLLFFQCVLGNVGLAVCALMGFPCVVPGDWWVNDGVADLVFFQNGMLEPWLESKGLNDANQVLAYFAVSKLGATPVDGKTDTNPEGLTAAYGKWASAVAARLNAGGLSCKVFMIWV